MRAEIRYNNIIDSDQARIAQAAADKAPELPAERIDADFQARGYVRVSEFRLPRMGHGGTSRRHWESSSLDECHARRLVDVNPLTSGRPMST